MDLLTAIRQPVEVEMERYRAFFETALTYEDDFLGQALAYVRGRRGKMMRPLLTVLVARDAGAVCDATLRVAVTLELLHTASLVHDDVVDESGRRRGQASANAVYGNKVAVLVGDYMLSGALHQSALTGDIRCVDIIARLGGTLAEGEVFQLANIRNEESTEEAYFTIIRRKTAELFAACGRLGAITSGATGEREEAAARFGEAVGMCFQIRDDIFDYYSDDAIGKPTGNDMREGKLTLPILYALRATGDTEAARLAVRVKSGEASAEEIAWLIAFAKREGGIDYARSVMEDYQRRALEALTLFRNAEVRRALTLYLDFVIGRDM